MERNIYKIEKELFITSDEEIKEGDWVVDTFKNACPVIKQLTTEEEVLEVQTTEFKIILTTDQDLIKDGVQAIDDEFLEWFIKNPSCEEVEVKFIKDGWCLKEAKEVSFYKIIIPKEETKYILCGEANKFYRCVTCDSPCGSKGHYIEEPKTDYSNLLKQKEEDFKKTQQPYKQETLEEFAKNESEYLADWEDKEMYIRGFIEGAKWQAEQDKNRFSEEDVELIANEMVNWAIDNIGNQNPQSGKKFDEVITKFKKK